MPSHRVPKGTYVRNTADWYTRTCYWGGSSFLSTSGGPPWLTAIISLYNDAIDGSYLEVHAFAAANDGGVGTNVDFQPGTTGSFVVQGQPVQFDLPTSFGQIFKQVVSSPTQFGPGPIPNPITALAAGFEGANGMSGQPYWRVPAGYSLRFGSTENSADISIALWWVVLKST